MDNLKFVFLSIFILAAVFPFASAVQVTMDSNFSQGQTLLAVVSGNFIDQITPDNVVFYRGHVAIPIIDDVVNINGDFYIYALLVDKAPGDYYINISGVRYMKATKTVSDPIISNFSITSDTAAFSIDPGAVSSPGNFSVYLTNLQDNTVTVSIKPNSSSINSVSLVNLKSGERKKIDLTVNNSNNDLEKVKFTVGNYSYSLPVYLSSNQTTPSANEPGFEFQPSTVYVTLATNSSATRILYLKNTGNEDLEDISFNVPLILDPYITISTDSNTLNQNSSEQVKIEITSAQNPKTVEGTVIAYSGNISSAFDLTLNFTKNFIPANGSQPGTVNQTIVTTCTDLGGIVCQTNELCTGDSVYAKDGVCCLASCEIQKKSSIGLWIGWGILIVAILFLLWFYMKKYKKVKAKKPF